MHIRSRPPTRPLACVLVLASLGAAQEPATAGDVTEPGRSFERALDLVLGAKDGPRTLYFLIDATPSLVSAGFAKSFNAALARNKNDLGQTAIGLARVSVTRVRAARGKNAAVVLEPTTDHGRVARRLGLLLAKPSVAFQNVYRHVRRVAESMEKLPGKHELCLVTLENGDAEDDIEKTVESLARASVRFHAITSESYLADNYWQTNRSNDKPKGTTLTGSDGPFIDLPFKWLFQSVSVNELTPSGYASYGINRLASASGGRVFLYAPKPSGHQCVVYPTQFCPFCSGDHITASEIYWDARVRQLAPLTGARKDAFRDVAHDPYFRAVMRAWRSASKAGIVASSPPLRHAGSTVKPDRGQRAKDLGLMRTLGFGRNAKRAQAAIKDVDRILDNLDSDLERADKNGRGRPRQRAMAAMTRMLLRITRVNLLTYRGFCLELGVKLAGRTRTEYEPPEHAITDNPRRAMGISFRSMCLCHGAAPFREVELPGGEPLRKELDLLDTEFHKFLDRYAHTPFAVALHRSGIARFYLTFPGIARSIPRKRPRSTSETKPATPTKTGRPSRRGAGSGGSSGPTTGK